MPGEVNKSPSSKEQMAAYKYPRLVQFVESLPMSASGKLLWRKLQENERKTSIVIAPRKCS